MPDEESVLGVLNRILQERKKDLEANPSDMFESDVACLDAVIALLVVIDKLNRDEFDFGLNMVMRQAWLIGMLEARIEMALRRLMHKDATIGEARKLITRLNKLIKTRGREYG